MDKIEKIFKQSILPVAAGIICIVGIVYAATWIDPTANPPGNNVEAPINVSDAPQAKGSGNTPRTDKSASIVAGDFCLPNGTCLSGGGGDGSGTDYLFALKNGNVVWCPTPSCPSGYRLVSNVCLSAYGYWQGLGLCKQLTGALIVNNSHTQAECIAAGGTVDAASNSCKFNGSSCPSGWTQYGNWSETEGETCVGSSGGTSCEPTPVDSGSHAWQNYTGLPESKFYYDSIWEAPKKVDGDAIACGYNEDMHWSCWSSSVKQGLSCPSWPGDYVYCTGYERTYAYFAFSYNTYCYTDSSMSQDLVYSCVHDEPARCVEKNQQICSSTTTKVGCY